MKKKILLVINTMGRAGAEKALISMLKSFDYSRVTVSLLTIIDRGELFSEIPSQVKLLNKKPSVKPILGLGGSLYTAKKIVTKMPLEAVKYIPFAIRYACALKKKTRYQSDKLLWFLLARGTPEINEEFDLAIAYIEGASAYYVADKVKAKKKIGFLHISYPKAGYLREYDFHYFNKLDYICCVSEDIRNSYKEVFPELASRTRLFPNIILSEEIREKAEEKCEFDEGFKGIRLVTVGRLHPQKGYDIAIPAFARLVKQGYDNIKWYIIGDGTQKPLLEKLIKRHGVEGKFILLGSRPNPYPYIKKCDIYLQPSRFEGFSLTLAEAIILHKPCISTNFDGVCALLTDNVNNVFIELTEESISDAIKKMIDDESFRLTISEGAKNLNLQFPNKTEILQSIAYGIDWNE